MNKYSTTSLIEGSVFDRESVRALMRAWASPSELSRHPLAQRLGREPSYSLNGSTPAQALRELIQRALELAFPHDADLSRAQRKRALVEQHYLHGEPLKALAEAFSIDERTARRILAEALDDLGEALRKLVLQQPQHARILTRINLAPPIALHPLLVGRETLLAQLVENLTPTGEVYAVWGIPGVGKTALLTHLAHHEVTHQRFPDGVLWADLSPQTHVLSVLQSWGTALGLSQADLARLSVDENMLGRMIQSALEDRRMLIVLNDAWSADRASKLLLGGPCCCHLVATRFADVALSLAPMHCAQVPPLTAEQGLMLIQTLAPDTAHCEPEVISEIVAWCGGLPLALTLVGRYLARVLRSGQPRRIEAALNQLREVHSRRALLANATEPALAELSRVIQASVERLTLAQRQALHILVALPPRPATFDESVVLAVVNGDVAALDALVDLGFVECADGAYSLHPVVRDTLWSDESAAEFHRTGQLRMVHAARALVETKERHTDFSASDRALILAAVHAVIELGLSESARALALKVASFLDACALLPVLDELLTTAQADAAPAREAIWLRACHARVLVRLGRMQAARAQASQSVTLAERDCPEMLPIALSAQARVALASGETEVALAACERAQALEQLDQADPRVKLELLRLHGSALHNSGRYAEAQAILLRAFEVAQMLQAIEEEVLIAYALGATTRQQRRYKDAEQWLSHALRSAQAASMSEQMALALVWLGVVANEQGQYDKAANCFTQAEPIARRLGLPSLIIQLRHAQGVLSMRLGRLDQAEHELREALHHAEAAQWNAFAANVSIELSECLLAMRRLDEAERVCTAGLEKAQRGQLDDLAALLRYVLSRLRHAQGDKAAAQALAQVALEQVQRSGNYRAAEVAAWAAELRGSE
ncbi:MAG: NB-ARC domain-containing protein [Anaerolineae bacterium]|nr:NB-ARC domain-containing protein [Thermoflexales bacterium]MDW8395884.1 NB-ARC domain-containing protein [Anaerolineae bacterium]